MSIFLGLLAFVLGIFFVLRPRRKPTRREARRRPRQSLFWQVMNYDDEPEELMPPELDDLGDHPKVAH